MSTASEDPQTNPIKACEQCTKLFKDPDLLDIGRTWPRIWNRSLANVLAAADLGCLLCQLLQKHFRLGLPPDSPPDQSESLLLGLLPQLFGKQTPPHEPPMSSAKPAGAKAGPSSLTPPPLNIQFWIGQAKGQSILLSLNVKMRGVEVEGSWKYYQSDRKGKRYWRKVLDKHGLESRDSLLSFMSSSRKVSYT